MLPPVADAGSARLWPGKTKRKRSGRQRRALRNSDEKRIGGDRDHTGAVMGERLLDGFGDSHIRIDTLGFRMLCSKALAISSTQVVGVLNGTWARVVPCANGNLTRGLHICDSLTLRKALKASSQ